VLRVAAKAQGEEEIISFMVLIYLFHV